MRFMAGSGSEALLWPNRPVLGMPVLQTTLRLSLQGAAAHAELPCISKSGKPRITAKNTFAVKHLHHKWRLLAGLDAGFKVVDNLTPSNAKRTFRRLQKRRCPQ